MQYVSADTSFLNALLARRQMQTHMYHPRSSTLGWGVKPSAVSRRGRSTQTQRTPAARLSVHVPFRYESVWQRLPPRAPPHSTSTSPSPPSSSYPQIQSARATTSRTHRTGFLIAIIIYILHRCWLALLSAQRQRTWKQGWMPKRWCWAGGVWLSTNPTALLLPHTRPFNVSKELSIRWTYGWSTSYSM